MRHLPPFTTWFLIAIAGELFFGMFDIPYESVLGMLVMLTSYIWAMPLYLPRELGVIVPLLDEAIGRKLSLRLASFTGCVFLDEAALLTTLAYVDMNVMAAGMAKTPEESAHPSVKARAEHCREIGMLPNLAQAPSSGLRPPFPPRGEGRWRSTDLLGGSLGLKAADESHSEG